MARSMNVPRIREDRIADTIRFYELLARVERRVGGVRTLETCDGRMGWPLRGVYFFFEAGKIEPGPAAASVWSELALMR